MGDRGANAGGFAYMEVIMCPKCGMKRKLGHQMISEGAIYCGGWKHMPHKKCEERRKKGHLLHRLPNGGEHE